MIVKKENYILRPWRESDCNSLAYYANNISIWNNLRDSFPHPYTSDDADAFIKMASVEPYSQFAIEVSGRAVGGMGIVSDALSELISYIFTETDLIRLYALTFDFNEKSMRVLRRNGFKQLAVMHRMGIKNGKIIDMHYYELLKPY